MKKNPDEHYVVDDEHSVKCSFSGEARKGDWTPMMTWDKVFDNDFEMPKIHGVEDGVAIKQIQLNVTAGEVCELLIEVWLDKDDPSKTMVSRHWVENFNIGFNGQSVEGPKRGFGGIRHVTKPLSVN